MYMYVCVYVCIINRIFTWHNTQNQSDNRPTSYVSLNQPSQAAEVWEVMGGVAVLFGKTDEWLFVCLYVRQKL